MRLMTRLVLWFRSGRLLLRRCRSLDFMYDHDVVHAGGARSISPRCQMRAADDYQPIAPLGEARLAGPSVGVADELFRIGRRGAAERRDAPVEAHLA